MEVIGWFNEETGEMYCPACTPSNELTPVYADFKTRWRERCEICGEPIPTIVDREDVR